MDFELEGIKSDRRRIRILSKLRPRLVRRRASTERQLDVAAQIAEAEDRLWAAIGTRVTRR